MNSWPGASSITNRTGDRDRGRGGASGSMRLLIETLRHFVFALRHLQTQAPAPSVRRRHDWKRRTQPVNDSRTDALPHGQKKSATPEGRAKIPPKEEVLEDMRRYLVRHATQVPS